MASRVEIYKNEEQKRYDLTPDARAKYRKTSEESREAKRLAEEGLLQPIHDVNTPNFKPEALMPQMMRHELSCLSLFSGGGGLDLGFDLAGYRHLGSYELIPICGDTIKLNRPDWNVFSGPEDGDVTLRSWKSFRGLVDVVHGGPPCQPFSLAGQRSGKDDKRNMWGEFVRAVLEVKPRAFVAENVLGLLSPKFESFVREQILDPLSDYSILRFELNAADFGVPQLRRRVFFVGFEERSSFKRFRTIPATHSWEHLQDSNRQQTLELYSTRKTMGVREALGLVELENGFDAVAPTIRSGFTGKRNTTSILNSAAGQKAWGALGIWPNGVQRDRLKASQFPAKNGHFRLSVKDCGLLQGFPENWEFSGAVYQVLGQIGNSVAPPVAYQLATNVTEALV